MNIGFIGAGKVGTTLGKLFAEGGIPVTGFYSRHRESAEEAAAFTDTNIYETLEAIVRDSDALFLTVPDGTIGEVFTELKQYDLGGKKICHCSGAMTSREAFPEAESTGAEFYSIHPLFPVSSKFEAYRNMTGAFFCLEGDSQGLPAWAELLEGLGCKTKCIAQGEKVKYHAACVTASNLMCGLLAESLKLLDDCGFSEPEALEALSPLVCANTERMLAVGPEAALTGPVERNDTGTVKKHLGVLDPDEQVLYKALSLELVKLAAHRHPEQNYETLLALLKGEN